MKWILLTLTAFLATACVTVRSEQLGYTSEQLLLAYVTSCQKARLEVDGVCRDQFYILNPKLQPDCTSLTKGQCLEEGVKYLQDVSK